MDYNQAMGFNIIKMAHFMMVILKKAINMDMENLFIKMEHIMRVIFNTIISKDKENLWE